MSGLEVAGVVLAVIPLLISAIEHYEEGLRPFRVLKEAVYRQELAHYRTKLIVEHGLYTNALEELLVEVVPQQELRNMITQVQCPLWKDPALDDRLRKRLGTIYDTYFLVMKQMQEVMAKIASLLDVEKQGNITGPQLEHLLLAHPPKPKTSGSMPHSTMYEFKRKLKFGFRSGHIQPLLEELSRYNNAIYQFTESSKRLEGQRSAAPKRTFTSPIYHIRDCAESLHKCLSKAWTCSLHADHVVGLQLESRVSKPDAAVEDSEESVAFTIAFSDRIQLDHWHCLQVHVFTGEDQLATKMPSKVNFGKVLSVPSVDVSTLPTIDCLCASVSVQQGSTHQDLCLDHKQRLLGGYTAANVKTAVRRARNGSTTSLDEVLSGSSAARGRRPFSSKQAYILGLTVASSFLQLRATPWLCGSWRAQNVLFIIEAAANVIDLERPYIRQTYPSPHQQQTLPQATASAGDADDNSSFLNLGIMLLEIFFREPIDFRRLPADSGPSQSLSDLQTALRWVQQDKEEMPVGFHKAVSFCIGCFASTNVDLQDTAFRQTVVDQVILPLKDELKLWNA